MASPRFNVYCWPTWITAHLAGDNSCVWQAWFRAHHTYQKLPSDFDLALWQARHAEMVQARAGQLRADGWTVTVEDQNKITLRGNGLTLGGKPDIVAVKDQDVLVSECKSGQRRASDTWQALMYLFALPLTGRYTFKALRGELVYPDGIQEIPAGAMTPAVKDRITALLKMVGGNEPPAKAPSSQQCGFCDIPKAECPERVETEDETATTDLF